MISNDHKERVIQELNQRIGSDIHNLEQIKEIEQEYVARKTQFQKSLELISSPVSSKFANSREKATQNSKEINTLAKDCEKVVKKVEAFFNKTEPLRNELQDKLTTIGKLEKALAYMRSLEIVQDLSRQLSQCNDHEQSVLLFGDLKELCSRHQTGHRATLLRDTTHYWHNILKDKLAKEYDDILKILKWPFVNASAAAATPPADTLTKFSTLTQFLFLIELPHECQDNRGYTGEEFVIQEKEPCLPIRLLLKPLKKRFAYHFCGNRRTARPDRPEWFLTQTLLWIRDHAPFVRSNVQPIANKLELKGVRAEEELVHGLVVLAAERLHSILGVGAALAHAVDEALGFQRELTALYRMRPPLAVITMLTRAEVFVKWLEVEKKYALVKMDEMLSAETWMEAVEGDVGMETEPWVPRGADWFVSLLKTIEERYMVLPQPGHKLQFVELQLELVEEWRVRLTQLVGAAGPGTRAHISALNAAHYTRSVLLQWAHSLHYLQLHYYRKQFQHFTELQHQPITEEEDIPRRKNMQTGPESTDEAMSLVDVESSAKQLAKQEAERTDNDKTEECVSPGDPGSWSGCDAESGVFGEAPALLARLCEVGLGALVDHVLLEFKAGLRDYKNIRWHSMELSASWSRSVSSPLCAPLDLLCTSLHRAALAPPLRARLRATLAMSVDQYLYEEVVLENWWSPGGCAQLAHDITRNLLPAIAPHASPAATAQHLPRLSESCILLMLELKEANSLLTTIENKEQPSEETLAAHQVRHIPAHEARQILSQRKDLNTYRQQAFMEMF